MQRRLAQAAMRTSYWIIVTGVLVIAAVADPILGFLGADISFVTRDFWLILALGGLAERYGAMHLQLYSTTNHILWHWINGATGLIFIAVVVAFYPVVTQYAFPIAYCVSNIGFYSWYSARLSYSALGISGRQFELSAIAGPLTTFFLGAALLLFLS